jgi:hypothetical protein
LAAHLFSSQSAVLVRLILYSIGLVLTALDVIVGPTRRAVEWGVNKGGNAMSLGTILLIVLVLILIGVIPTWGHSRAWGYGPSGIVGLILVVVLILALLGKL